MLKECILLSAIVVLLVIVLFLWIQNRKLKRKLNMYRQEYRAMFGTYNI